jgi:hypothetical protein
VRVQAGNAEATTAAGVSKGGKSRAIVTLFEDTDAESRSAVSPLDGLRLSLQGAYAESCCDNIAIVRAGKGPHAAELSCAVCGKHCGWLPKAAAKWLLDILAFWPEAKRETHVLRNVKATDPRGLDFGNSVSPRRRRQQPRAEGNRR